MGFFICAVQAFVTLCFVLTSAQKVYKTDASQCCSLDPANATQTCEPILLTATKYEQHLETPNYPRPFPKKTICTWAIKINKGSRIYAVIEKFHLIVPNEEGCFVQTIVIRSPIYGLKMGPFCGKTGIPIINTPDNLLIIQLIDLGSPAYSEYMGFRIKFHESYETPNIELRPQNWFHNFAKPFTMNEPQLRYTLAQIDPRKNEDLKIDVPDLPDDPPPTQKPKIRRPPKRKPPTKTFKPRVRSRPKIRSPQPATPPPSYETDDSLDDANGDEFFTLEVIIGIAIGGFVALSLITIAIVKVCYQRRRKKTANDTVMKNHHNYRHHSFEEADAEWKPKHRKQKYLQYDHKNPCTMHNETRQQRRRSLPPPSASQRQIPLVSTTANIYPPPSSYHNKRTSRSRPLTAIESSTANKRWHEAADRINDHRRTPAKNATMTSFSSSSNRALTLKDRSKSTPRRPRSEKVRQQQRAGVVPKSRVSSAGRRVTKQNRRRRK